ncbi:hypothetical protein B0J11DRAFT_535582 [Dendryphion nanum]|uniref:Uncharacterized protein n=1 Tax=Dendryphion nanum TaxID=256645 RepID=A0A9P9DHT8_9PLEO|nr:hypothetical protein B0J11DRAFT_535582 [Dendryphion nanum]
MHYHHHYGAVSYQLILSCSFLLFLSLFSLPRVYRSPQGASMSRRDWTQGDKTAYTNQYGHAADRADCVRFGAWNMRVPLFLSNTHPQRRRLVSLVYSF